MLENGESKRVMLESPVTGEVVQHNPEVAGNPGLATADSTWLLEVDSMMQDNGTRCEADWDALLRTHG
jgi:glycine cleavage system H lipoate-binding protein